MDTISDVRIMVKPKGMLCRQHGQEDKDTTETVDDEGIIVIEKIIEKGFIKKPTRMPYRG